MINIVSKGVKFTHALKSSLWSTGTRTKRKARPVVEASGYYPPGEISCMTAAAGYHELEETHVCGFYQTLINDNIDATCVNTTIGDRLLQVMFNFRHVNISHQVSVEVVMKNVEDYSSFAWTWFVQSECHMEVYRECDSKRLQNNTEFARYIVTCQCWESCHYLHVVYNPLPWQGRSKGQLCEVWLLWKTVMLNSTCYGFESSYLEIIAYVNSLRPHWVTHICVSKLYHHWFR